MPEEPAEGAEGVIKISLRFPDGNRVTRRFLKSDPLKVLFDVAAATQMVHPDNLDLDSQFPRFTLRSKGLENKMETVDLHNSMLMVRVNSGGS